jgi:UDP-N-acetylmuramyl pentapeptide phosphotransferase/UDP-N-acetylglucosamine-1-phosphate transferase
MNPSHVSIDNWPQILACFALGFCLCWALIGIILRRAEHAAVGQRKEFHHAHKEPIPRLGGVALASAFVVVALAVAFYTPVPANGVSPLLVIVLSSLAMFGLGLWDDLRKLGAKFKLLAQIGIASAVYLCNIRIDIFHEPFTGADWQLGAFGYVATVLWLVSLTNLINLIDGIDGLAGGIGLMLMLLMANLGVTDHLDFCALLAFGVAGALLGFLKYNYPPARIYMGDGGAYFLGFLIGILSIVNSNKGTVAAALIAPAFALALPIVDVSLAILRRGARGLPVFLPDSASPASGRCSISTPFLSSACSSRSASSACKGACCRSLPGCSSWCCSSPVIFPVSRATGSRWAASWASRCACARKRATPSRSTAGSCSRRIGAGALRTCGRTTSSWSGSWASPG